MSQSNFFSFVTTKKDRGKKGEDLAISFLKKKKYKIEERNFFGRNGEIDIIAYDKKRKERVFVEVKYRINDSFGYPEDAVDENKMNKMSRAIYKYLDEKKIREKDWRIDCVAIRKKGSEYEIKHFVNIG